MPTERQRRRLLKRFDRLAAILHSEMVVRYGEVQSNKLLPRMRQGFNELIPAIPDVGGRPPFTLFIHSTAVFLALYREMQKEGHSTDEVGNLIYVLTERYVRGLPGMIKLALSRLMFSRIYLNRARRRAPASGRLPEGFEFEFVEGDGASFDYGIDYHGCAVVKFLQKHNAPELAPYICRLDIIYSEELQWGLTRTTTIANGFDRCDFRFRQGGPTRVKTDYR